MSEQPSNCYTNAPTTNVGAYIVDFIALIRTAVEIPNTFEELGLKLLKMVPSGYPRVDFVADTYRTLSIKNAERAERGTAPQIIIKSIKSKVPRDFHAFLSNGENKSKMISLLFYFYCIIRFKVLNTLRATKVVCSEDTRTRCITLSNVRDDVELKSNQEEADTKVILHCQNALECDPDSSSSVILRSHSADTDITDLCISLLSEFKERLFLDSGTGKTRKGFWLSSIELR